MIRRGTGTDDPEDARDNVGCAFATARFACGTVTLLYLLMFAAIFAVAVLSLLLFR